MGFFEWFKRNKKEKIVKNNKKINYKIKSRSKETHHYK